MALYYVICSSLQLNSFGDVRKTSRKLADQTSAGLISEGGTGALANGRGAEGPGEMRSSHRAKAKAKR